MLGRKTFERSEIDHARTAMTEQIAAYRSLAAAASGPKGRAAVEAFEPLLCNQLALALDRPFVHRVRGVSGKDDNPLNELEMIVESLMNHDGVLAASTVLRYDADTSVLHLAIGEPIRFGVEQLEQLAAAFFEELERRFLA